MATAYHPVNDTHSEGERLHSYYGKVSDNFGERVHARLNDFGFNKLHEDALLIAEHFSAIRKHNEVGDMFNPNRLRDFGHFLQSKNIDSASGQARTLAALNADMLLVQGFINNQYSNYIAGLNSQTGRPAPGKELSADIPLCDFDDLLNLVSEKSEEAPNGQGVNLEVLAILATSYYVELEDQLSERGDPTKLLKLVYATKAICAPFAEITGFDGLAMGLNSLADRIQLESKLEPETYGAIHNQAKQMIDSLGSPESIAGRVTDVLDGFGVDSVADVTLPSGSGHSVKYGIGTWEAADLGMSELSQRLVWRVKSLGSLMKRLHRIKTSDTENKNAAPTDVLAMTLVTKSVEQSAILLQQMAATIVDSDSPQYIGVASPKRNKFVHVQGSKEYLDAVKNSVSPEVWDLVHDEDTDSGFEVSKVTFHHRTSRYTASGALEDDIVPVEIQILTERARIASRIEEPSHTIYKAGKLPKERVGNLVNIIQKLHTRRREMKNGEPTTQSLERGDKDLRQIKQQQPRRLGWSALKKRPPSEPPRHRA
ncbi:MAG TPA: hypothetical protein VGE34_04410 [Candidatus Saccharimonadales bacterium]